MNSKLAEALKMRLQPVAVIWTNHRPENALQFQQGKGGCVTSMINAAAKGRTVVFDENTCGCVGGASSMGFSRLAELDGIEYILSSGDEINPGDHYKQSPELARKYVNGLPHIPTTNKYVVLKPLGELSPSEVPKVIILLVNPDQLSALVVLANYDKPTQDNVKVLFAGGCHSTILQALEEDQQENPKAIIGMIDPMARKVLDKDLLAFSLPYKRFLQMEESVEGSFLTKANWIKLAERIS